MYALVHRTLECRTKGPQALLPCACECVCVGVILLSNRVPCMPCKAGMKAIEVLPLACLGLATGLASTTQLVAAPQHKTVHARTRNPLRSIRGRGDESTHAPARTRANSLAVWRCHTHGEISGAEITIPRHTAHASTHVCVVFVGWSWFGLPDFGHTCLPVCSCVNSRVPYRVGMGP